MSQQFKEFPLDPLEDVTPLADGESSLGYSLYSSNTQKSFNLASKDLAQLRPTIPSSEISVVRILPKTMKVSKEDKQDKGPITKRSTSFNQHKLEQLPPKTDPYELVKLCRQGWTLSKVLIYLSQ